MAAGAGAPRARPQGGPALQVAYVPQTAFIFNETVRNNILFGMPWDEDKYQRVIQAANMAPDLALLQGGTLCCQHSTQAAACRAAPAPLRRLPPCAPAASARPGRS